MQTLVQIAVISASSFGGWEIMVLLAAVLLILIAGRRLSDLGRGLGQGFQEFLKATREVQNGFDQDASDAGKSLGGIYGKPAQEALAPDNQTAELYDPAVLRQNKGRKKFERDGKFYCCRQFC